MLGLPSLLTHRDPGTIEGCEDEAEADTAEQKSGNQKHPAFRLAGIIEKLSDGLEKGEEPEAGERERKQAGDGGSDFCVVVHSSNIVGETGNARKRWEV